jgi:ABC-type phosphate transport system permease subunit
MGMTTHGAVPASAASTGATVTAATQTHGAVSDSLVALGLVLLALTIVFAVAAIISLLPRRVRRTADLVSQQTAVSLEAAP